MGHLASDLAKISSFLENPKNTKAVSDILEESKFFIEWLAPEAPIHIKELFSEMQPKLALWQLLIFRNKEAQLNKKDLQHATKIWSSKLIKLSGLLAA